MMQLQSFSILSIGPAENVQHVNFYKHVNIVKSKIPFSCDSTYINNFR